MSHTFSVCSACHAVNKLSLPKRKDYEPVCGRCGKNLPMKGHVTEVDQIGFEKLLSKSDKPVVVDFWASWCGPCRVYGPEFERASNLGGEAVFVKINTETETNLASQLSIRGIPCTVLFSGGREIARQSGAMSASDLQAWIKKTSP